MKFKNLRRPSRAAKAGVNTPPPKKMKTDGAHEVTVVELSASDLAEYEQHVKHLKKTYMSQKWSLTSMQGLLEQTATIRQRWIRDEIPPVRQVLEKFPCLKEPKLVSLSETSLNYFMIHPSYIRNSVMGLE